MSWSAAEHKDVASGWVMNAYEELEKDKEKHYIIPLAEKLKADDDDQKWDPSQSVMRWLPKGQLQDVKRLSDEGVKLNDVAKEMISNKDVGIVLMGPQVGRSALPYAIAIVLNHVIYLADPKNREKDMHFLMIILKLKDKKIQFWTTNGLHESDCLYEFFRIDLTESNAVCATGMHVHLLDSIRKKTRPIRCAFTSKVYEKAAHKEIYIESYEELVETWLEVPKSDIYYDKARMSHLLTEPLDLAAINMVKKRCCLVLSLCRQLRKFQNYEFNQMSLSVCRRLISLEESLSRDVYRYIEKKTRCGHGNRNTGGANNHNSTNINNVSSITEARYVDYARYVPLSLGLPSRRINNG